MRLCVITGTFHPEPGGPPTYLYYLLPALIERGHTVSVLTYGESLLADREMYPYPVMRLSRRVSIPRRLLALTREVLRQGRMSDVLFICDYGLPAAAANLWLRKPMAIKIVADFSWEFASRHGWTSLPVSTYQTTRHTLRVRVLRAIQRWYASRADVIIVPSQHIRQLVSGWGIPVEKLRVIFNALPSGIIDIPSKSEARHRLDWPSAEPILVTVGRLAEVKRIDLQLLALTTLARGRLMVVGDGPERSALQSLAGELGLSERVIFTGALPREQALLAIRAADLFVLSSRTEGLSHVLLEAMQLGTPCVASNVGGNPEIITDGMDGLLVPDDDVNAFAAALRSLLDDPSRREQLAAAALESVRRFSWESLVEQTEAVLREVAGV